jgi:hypothetical protein
LEQDRFSFCFPLSSLAFNITHLGAGAFCNTDTTSSVVF